MSAPTLYYARWVSGDATRQVRRNLTRDQLERLRDDVEPAGHVEWSVEPMEERERG